MSGLPKGAVAVVVGPSLRAGNLALTSSSTAALLGPGGPCDRFPVGDRAEEFDALVELLAMNRTSGTGPEALQVARAIAAGCLGERHLWRDLGLPDRASLRALIERFFAPLAAENDRDMRWKLFFYRKLCGWNGFST